MGHIAWYCPSTAPVGSTALTETPAVASTMRRTASGNYWRTVTNWESPLKESWCLDCATTTHNWGDRETCPQGAEYTMRDERVIHDFARSITGKAIWYGDVPFRLWVSEYHHNFDVILQNVLYIDEAYSILSISWLVNWLVRIVSVNCCRIKICTDARSHCKVWGQWSLMGVTIKGGLWFQLNVIFTWERYQARA